MEALFEADPPLVAGRGQSRERARGQRLGPLDQQAVWEIVADILQAHPDEDRSTIQLVINLSAIAVAGTLTSLLHRARADQLPRRSPARIA